MDRKILIGALALQLSALPAIAETGCAAQSGPGTTALVELYTSEGCSSCPPADRWIAGLPNGALPLAKVVPLAFHVDYWDYLGWKDEFADPGHARRQAWLAALNGRRTSYTPHFFVAGAEVLDWRGRIAGEIAKVGAGGTAARIEVSASPAGANRLAITTRATADNAQAQLFVAVTESGLVTAVRAGENRGATLRHDHVVRALLGPLPLGEATREVALGAGWQCERLRIAAFVQDLRTGRVLQAVATERCSL
jgi:hypothetical protein